MNTVNSPDFHIEKILEATDSELYASSGIIDHETGRELTNIDFVKEWEEKQNGGEVYLNGHLSPEAVKYNASLSTKQMSNGGRMLAVMAKRPLH